MKTPRRKGRSPSKACKQYRPPRPGETPFTVNAEAVEAGTKGYIRELAPGIQQRIAPCYSVISGAKSLARMMEHMKTATRQDWAVYRKAARGLRALKKKLPFPPSIPPTPPKFFWAGSYAQWALALQEGAVTRLALGVAFLIMQRDSKTFRDIADIIDATPRCDEIPQCADPAAKRILMATLTEDDFLSRTHTIAELQAICGKPTRDERTVRRLAKGLGIKINGPGRPKKSGT